MLELEILQPGVPAAAAQLPPGAYLVGSGAECHIRLKRPEISSRHAQLIVRDNRLLVMDLGSRNRNRDGGRQHAVSESAV